MKSETSIRLRATQKALTALVTAREVKAKNYDMGEMKPLAAALNMGAAKNCH